MSEYQVMKKPIMLCCAILGLFQTLVTHAALKIAVAEPKPYGQKAILKMELHNTFTNAIESARAFVFLLDDKGKVVGQETRWIVGGTKDRPSLAQNANSTFNFVVQSSQPFTSTKITVTRMVLEGGRLADVNKDVQISLPRTE
jgi:hypothetical protein